MNLNSLLQAQINKHLPGASLNEAALEAFIREVNQTYNNLSADTRPEVDTNIEKGPIPVRVPKALNPELQNGLHLPGNNFHQTADAINNDTLQASPLQPLSPHVKLLMPGDAEDDISAAGHWLSQLMNNLQSGILLEDEHRNIILTNQLFCDMFALSLAPAQLKGMNAMDTATVTAGLFLNQQQFTGQHEKLLQLRQSVTGEELEMKDGRILSRDYMPIYFGNEYRGHLWKYMDVTAQKENERQLKRLALVASANENGVAFCNDRGVINWANEGFLKMSGYAMEEVIGKKAVELCIGPLSDPEAIQKMLQAFYSGKGFNVEIIHYRKDGSWFWGRLRGQSVCDEQGNVQQYFAMVDDITQEKEREEQLSVLSLIAEDNSNAVIITDTSGYITWVNKSFVTITGYTLEEVKGQKPGLMKGSETNPDTIAYLEKQMSAGESFNCELLNYAKNGNKYWLRIQGQAIRNNKGELTGFFALEEDITQEKEDQEKLKEYESRFRKAFEKIGDSVWEQDFGTGKTYFSNTTNHLLGYRLDEFTDNANLWLDRTYVDDRILLDQNEAKYRRGDIDHHMLEYRVLHKDGTIRWVLDRGVVIETGRDNKPLKIIGTHTDITERKQAEELLQREEQKYRSIIANMNLGLLEVDTEEKVIFTNQSFCEMSGYDYDELMGKKASEIYVKEENIELIESKNEARKKGSLAAYEIAVKNKQGELRWWLISGAPRYNDAGDLVGSLGIHLDITDQKQLEIDLIEAREQAEESTRSKEVFLANMSHEIRTPMNAILGMTHQLAKTRLDSKQHFYLDTINSASENLLVIINDILDLSKIEAGKLNLENIGFEARAVINRAMQVMRHKAEEKGLSITNSRCDANISPVLMGDPYRLNQVLLNLISNAIKFTEKGSVDLSCAVLEDTPFNQLVLIEVRDTGIGMEEHFVTSLFEKFSQEDVSVTRQYGGTGLGMSICKDLIGLMGGEIVVSSKKGEGTSIIFKVRFSKGRPEDLPSRELFYINKDMLSNKRILVVDDNNMNRLVAKTILNNFGAVTIEAVNGREAIDYLKQLEVDLVLMDIQMPVMGGLEATRIIREEISVSLPVIALTANAIKGDNEKCIEGGMNAYLSKPFKEEDLLQIVSIWLGADNESIEARPAITSIVVEKLYDLSTIRSISRGNEAFVLKMVNMFIDQTPGQVAEMEAMYHHSDYKGMAAIAHKIKPSIDNMGILSLKLPIREIERIGKAGQGNESIPQLLDTVASHISIVIDTLQDEFETASNAIAI